MTNIKTYQDLTKVLNDESAKMSFLLTAIREHESSALFKFATMAEDYYKHKNPTIMAAQKFVYDVLGRACPDYYTANNKIPCRYYPYFITQEVQYLLGNGVNFSDENTKQLLGKNFDNSIQKIATKALNAGVAFGFWNFDHIEVFGITKNGSDGSEPAFVPLYDEESGALRAGIRYWQISDDKPLRIMLFEEDGITEYIKRKDEDMELLQPKIDYKQDFVTSEVSGTQIYNGGNYPTFPIVPMWNVNRQSELVGGKETIDAYDLMLSALINNIDDANLIYWVIKNCGGMDDMDDAKFVERLKTLHVAHADGDDGASVEAHSVEAPFEANETALTRLRTQLFDDFMALDTKSIASGAATATQIQAAYEPLNSKTDQFEYQVTEFINGILTLAGIEDNPTYTRSLIVNKQEEVQMILQAANHLTSDYVTEKILTILGDIDRKDDILQQIAVEEQTRFNNPANIAETNDEGDEFTE